MTAILPYLALQGKVSGPLFILHDGRMLTRQVLFSSILYSLLKELNLTQQDFNTHSFHIGAATYFSKSDKYI